MYVNKADKEYIAEALGTLADLASLRDIDVTVLVVQAIAARVGIKTEDIPGFTALEEL